MIEERCENCRYYRGYVDGDGNQLEGECLRYPTKVIKPPYSWCGEYKPKEGKNED
jgi:hypothetical protein